LGGGNHHRVRSWVHRRLVTGHQPTHHVRRRAVVSAHPDDLRMLIMPFRGCAFDNEEVANPGLHRPLPSLEVVRCADRSNRARFPHSTEARNGRNPNMTATTWYWRATGRAAVALSGLQVRADGDMLPFRDLFRAPVRNVAIQGQSVGPQEQESRGLV